jgi:hypothetical protein
MWGVGCRCISNKPGKLVMKGDPGGSWSSILFHNDKTLPSWTVDCVTFDKFLEVANINADDIIFIKIDIEGAEHTVLPNMRKWLRKHGNPPIWVSMHKWLWEAGDAAKEKMAAVFRDYDHVLNSRLEEVPRDSLESGATFFGDQTDSVYLLTMKMYKFLDLRTSDFGDRGGPVPMPTAAPVRRARKSARADDEDDDELDTMEDEEGEGDGPSDDTEDADDDGEEVEEEEVEEEVEEPEPPRRKRRSRKA